MSEHRPQLMDHAAIPLRLIVRCVSEAYGVPERLIYSQRRDAETLAARSAVYWLAGTLGIGSASTIGRSLGNRDHTTVLHGIKESEERRSKDPKLAARLDGLLLAIEQIARKEAVAAYRDPDVVGIAERIVRDPRGRFVTEVSTVELVAVCARLLDLEDVAGGAYQLLAHIDELDHATGERRAALQQSTRALIESVSSTLATLGYAPEAEPSTQETNHDAASANA